MTETFVYESYCIAVCHIIALCLLVSVNAVIFIKAVGSPLLKSFLILQGMLALWIVSKIFKTFAPDENLKFFFVVCQYAAVCFLGPAFIAFSRIFSTGARPPRSVMAALLSASAACFLAVATNPLHHLFYTRFDFWGDSFGPLFYVEQAYSYALFAAGTAMCAKKFFSGFGEKRAQAALVALAISIPIAANALYVFRLFRSVFGFTPPFDITPMSASASLLIFAFATFRLRFFDSLKVARETAMSNVPEGILLLQGNRVVGYNRTFREMALSGALSPEKSANRPSSSIIFRGRAAGAIPVALAPGKAQDFTYRTKTGSTVRVVCTPAGGKSADGAFVRFIDVTEREEMLRRLKSKNEELKALNSSLSLSAEIKRRLVAARTLNQMAQEAHDILGHSVMLAISLLEIARMSGSPEQARAYVYRAKNVLARSLGELRRACAPGEQPRSPPQDISERLSKLAGEFKSALLEVEVHCSGLDGRLKRDVEDAIFKLCREAITNALRHGRASRIDIVVRGRGGAVELYVIDNGIGCAEVKKGMGISGMERRVLALDGSFSCTSLGGQGFCVHAAIPAG